MPKHLPIYPIILRLVEARRFDDQRAMASDGALASTIRQSGTVRQIGRINRDGRLSLNRKGGPACRQTGDRARRGGERSIALRQGFVSPVDRSPIHGRSSWRH